MCNVYIFYRIHMYNGYLHGSSGGSVGERSGDREVSINRYHHQVPHTRVAGKIVNGEEGVAEVGGEGPLLHDQLHREQRNRKGSDDEVCYGEREEEVVGDGLELLVNLERHHHLDTEMKII